MMHEDVQQKIFFREMIKWEMKFCNQGKNFASIAASR